MKKNIILIIFCCKANMLSQTIDLRFLEIRNDRVNNGYFDVLIQIKASSSFYMGSSNFCFNYNSSGLIYSNVLSNSNFNSGKYSSELKISTSIISYNISYNDYNLASDAQLIDNNWRDLVSIRFIIKDQNELSGLYFRNYQDNYLNQSPTIVYKVLNNPIFSSQRLSINNVYNLDNPLPVILSNYSVKTIDYNNIIIEWETEDEKDILQYEIEAAFIKQINSIDSNHTFETLKIFKADNASSKRKKYFYNYNRFKNYTSVLFRIKIVNKEGTIEYSSTKKIENIYPSQFEFYPVYPNPFNSEANIEFFLSEKSDVNILVYDAAGREIEYIKKNDLAAGFHKIKIESRKYSSGVYFILLIANSMESLLKFRRTQKVILLK